MSVLLCPLEKRRALNLKMMKQTSFELQRKLMKQKAERLHYQLYMEKESDEYASNHRIVTDEKGIEASRFKLVLDEYGLPYVYKLEHFDETDCLHSRDAILQFLVNEVNLDIVQFHTLISLNGFMFMSNSVFNVCLYYIIKGKLTWRDLYMLMENICMARPSDLCKAFHACVSHE